MPEIKLGIRFFGPLCTKQPHSSSAVLGQLRCLRYGHGEKT